MTKYMHPCPRSQDEASRDFVFRAISSGANPKAWHSMFWYGRLVYEGDRGECSYRILRDGEHEFHIDRGDSSKRGAEYSAIEVFDGKIITFCDRTGNCDELHLSLDRFSGKTVVTSAPVMDSSGNRVCISMGDGSKCKPLKVEWTTQKNGKLIIGSTGKERTDDDGNVVHEGEMWIKVMEPGSYQISHIDARHHYRSLRDAAQGARYMIHESGRWSDYHKRWFFLPRKMSREPYDEIIDRSKCVNLMFTLPEPPLTTPLAPHEIGMQDILGCTGGKRGCSDFLFIPGTHDCHIFILRTEETIEDEINTYASVIDLEGRTLMAECLVGKNRKFEGAAWMGGVAHFPENPRPRHHFTKIGGNAAGERSQSSLGSVMADKRSEERSHTTLGFHHESRGGKEEVFTQKAEKAYPHSNSGDCVIC